MDYRILPDHLHSTADLVHKYISKNLGLSRISIESSIEDSIGYRPTFNVNTRDYYILCIDVSENVYNTTRWTFITECERLSLPVKFIVALPSSSYPSFSSDLLNAKKSGVGIIITNSTANLCDELCSAISLSLSGLRNFDKSKFPKKYRENISQAESTFKNGNPNKACSIIYDEIEALTRRIAIKSYKQGRWKNSLSNPVDLEDKMPWSKVIINLRDSLDRSKNSPYKILSTTLISQLHGITAHRNESGHKANSRKAIIDRDTRLRTRMESAIDLLQELSNAVKGLGV